MTPETNDEALSPVDEITQQFLSEYRAGNQPRVEAYCSQHPELAQQLRCVLSTAMVLEETRLAKSCTDAMGPEPAWERLGDYRLVRVAGRGGMGVVYEAIQESLGRRVALKTLPAAFTRGHSQIERFLREARAVASLHHTNIVPVFAVGQDQGVYYYVMPFIDGVGLEVVLKDLRRFAKQSGRIVDDLTAESAGIDSTTESELTLGDGFSTERTIPRVRSGESWSRPSSHRSGPSGPSIVSGPNQFATKEIFDQWVKGCDSSGNHSSSRSSRGQASRGYWHLVAGIGLQVAEALHYADQQGVLHRDIKPSNLLLDRDGIVWVTDFGLAKAASNDDLTATGQMLGTLRYLAPERLRGIHDIRGDVYGLGLTLYELVTLRTPFGTHDQLELTQQIIEREPIRPRKIDPRIPLDLETIVQKAIAKDPRDRYPSADSLADDLRLFTENRPINARRIGSMERSWRWCRRNPAIAGLIGFIVLLTAATIGVLAATNAQILRETAEKTAALTDKETALGERESAYRQSRVSEQLARSRFYAAQVNLAGHAFHSGEVTRAEDLLNSVIPLNGGPDFRGFEWLYLAGRLHEGLLRTLYYPASEITCLSFSPDGRRLLIGGGSLHAGFAQLVDVETGQTIFDVPNLSSNVNGCAFAFDGSALVVAAGDGSLQVFDAETLTLVFAVETGVLIKSVAWSPDGKLLVVGGERGELRFWKAPGFVEARLPNAHQGPILRLCFSRDSTRLYSSADWGGEGRNSRQWDTSKWPPELTRMFAGQAISDESPDGKTLAAINWGTLQVVDAHDGRITNEMQVSTGPLVSAKFHADGKSLVVASRNDRAVRAYDPKTLAELQVSAQTHTVSALAIGPQGRYWAAGDARGEVRIWDLRKPQPHSQLDAPDVHSAFFLNEREILLGGSSESRRWSLVDGSTRPFHQARGLRAVSSDGKTLVGVVPAVVDPNSQVIEIWREGSTEPERIPMQSPIYEQCLAVSASGRWLATRSDGKPIDLYDLSPSPPQHVRFLNAHCYHFAFSPDERWLVGGEQYGSVCCFDVETGTALAKFAEFDSFWAWSMSIAFSTNNRYVASGSESGTVRVWETDSRKLVATLLGQPGEIRSIAFFPDDRRLAVGGTGDVRIWDFQSGQELIGLPVSDGRVTSLAINHSGDVLAAVTPQGRIQTWSGQNENGSPSKPSAMLESDFPSLRKN